MNTDKHKKSKNKDRSRVHPDTGQYNGSFEPESVDDKQNNRFVHFILLTTPNSSN